MKNDNKLKLKQLSSLAKVFPNKIYSPTEVKQKNCVRGQTFSYQIAYRCERESYEVLPYELKIESDGALQIEPFEVETVPSLLPYFRGDNRSDDDYLTKKAGLFPDPLVPFNSNEIKVRVEFWRALWVTVKVPEDCPEGLHKIKISFLNADGTLAASKTFSVNCYPQILPEPQILMGQWFHCDCIADVHKTPIFSEKHWEIIENYMRLAAKHGMNVIFTPVLTPPIDTEIGGERPTVQLVDIVKRGNEYEFGFSRLRRWIALAEDCGFKRFEINHLFTQWGAEHAPKVIATENGETKRIFGWETDATSDEYYGFLKQLIPAVIKTFEESGVSRERLLFHLSDEPTQKNIEAYKKAGELLHPLIKGCSQFDALSDYAFYENGLVWEPVVANDHIDGFIEKNAKNLWVYHCCWQGNKVGNRLMSMPSYRNRVLGVQMYKAGVIGFLHWGYNFYYTRLSREVVNPYTDTDSGMEFPSGDAFSVYPSGDGAIPSIRLKVFAEALEDTRLLQLVEQKIGKPAVVEAIDKICGKPLTFTEYPRTDELFDRIHEFIFSNL